MSLVRRKARPLKRDKTTLRDCRLFIIACDDTYAPEQYFNFFSISRVKVYVVPTTDGTSSASHVLRRLLEYDHDDDDELWMLLDTDHYVEKTHVKKFKAALKEAKQKGVKVALSKPCFELWLLLHHLEASQVLDLANATEVESRLRGILGKFNKKRLRTEHYPAERVAQAIKEAKKLDSGLNGGDIPNQNTSRVYLLWKAIMGKALPSQLPFPLSKVI